MLERALMFTMAVLVLADALMVLQVSRLWSDAVCAFGACN